MGDIAYYIVYGLFSSGIIAGLVSIATKRFIKKLDDRDATKKEIKELKKAVRKLELDLAKDQLATLIRFFPDNHKAILDQAEHYFIELGGNSWAFSVLAEWANNENVSIGYLREYHAKNIKNIKEKSNGNN